MAVELTVRVMVVLALAVFLFTMYYLEREFEREKIFWGYAILGVLFGLASVIAVAKDSPNARLFLFLTTTFVLISIFYYEDVEKVPGKRERKVKKAKLSERDSYKALLEKLEISFSKGEISKRVYKQQKAEYERKLRRLE